MVAVIVKCLYLSNRVESLSYKKLDIDVTARFKASAKFRLGAAYALCDTPNSAVFAAEHRDDPISFP
jgi:hypothetical protein